LRDAVAIDSASQVLRPYKAHVPTDEGDDQSLEDAGDGEGVQKGDGQGGGSTAYAAGRP
jgi:hypothetical protein